MVNYNDYMMFITKRKREEIKECDKYLFLKIHSLMKITYQRKLRKP